MILSGCPSHSVVNHTLERFDFEYRPDRTTVGFDIGVVPAQKT